MNNKEFKHALQEIYLIATSANNPESIVSPAQRIRNIAEYIIKLEQGIHCSEEGLDNTFKENTESGLEEAARRG